MDPSSGRDYTPAQLAIIDGLLKKLCEASGCPYDLCEDGGITPWSGYVLGAADRFVLMKPESPTSDAYPSDVRLQLTQIRECFSGSTPDRTTAQILARHLDPVAHDALAYGVLRISGRENVIAALRRLPPPELLQAVDAALALVRSSGGRPAEAAFDAFVGDLVLIYKEITGTQPGRGHGNLTAQLTPFERLAMACVCPLRRQTEVDAIRGAMRRLRGKRR